MPSFINRTGKRYGRLKVIEIAGRNRHKQILWRCVCDCGNEIVTTSGSLQTGNTQGCGCKHPKRSLPLEERFWPKVQKTDFCWIWTGAREGRPKFQYGVIRGVKKNGFRMEMAHRVSWMIHNGPIPDGKQVLHRCDNPPCVNPSHLFVGTHQDNMDDCTKKGRRQCGERASLAKLTADGVKSIRNQYKKGARSKTLAEDFGVHQSTILGVLSGRTWKHVA